MSPRAPRFFTPVFFVLFVLGLFIGSICGQTNEASCCTLFNNTRNQVGSIRQGMDKQNALQPAPTYDAYAAQLMRLNDARQRISSRTYELRDIFLRIKDPVLRKQMEEARGKNERALIEMRELIPRVITATRSIFDNTQSLKTGLGRSVKSYDEWATYASGTGATNCPRDVINMRSDLSALGKWIKDLSDEPQLEADLRRLNELRRLVNQYPVVGNYSFPGRETYNANRDANTKDLNEAFAMLFNSGRVLETSKSLATARKATLALIEAFKGEAERSNCSKPNLTGYWSDDWGYKIVLNDGGSITGTFTSGNNVGNITGGSYDASTCKVTLTYEEPWKKGTGKAELTLSADGMRMSGSHVSNIPAYSAPQTGGWTMTRKQVKDSGGVMSWGAPYGISGCLKK